MALQQTRPPGSSQGGRKTSFATSLTEVATYDKEGIGTIRQEGTKWYKWIKYDAGTAAITAVAGLVVGYVAGTTNVSGCIVTPDVSDTNNIAAGVLMAAPADDGYGWVQIVTGKHQV